MEHLGTRDINALLNAVREIYADMNPASLPGTIVNSASRIIPSGTVVHAGGCREDPTIVAEALSCTSKLERWDAFNEYRYEHPFIASLNPEKIKLHPFRQDIERALRRLLGHCKQSPKSAVYKISDVLSNSQFRSLALFNEFFRFNGIEYQLGLPIFPHKNSVMALSFSRDKIDFTEKERSLLDMLAPHVIQAHKNAEVVSKIRNANNGEGKMLLDGKAKDLHPDTMKAIGITLREAEILHWISLGKTNAEISAIFNISLNTVKTHLQHIYEKLGVENRVAAARFVMGNGEGI